MSILGLLLLAPLLPQQVTRVRTHVPRPFFPLEVTLADVDGDGLLDLWIPEADDEGGRRLAIHRVRSDGTASLEPDFMVDMLPDVVLWGVGEFRDEPGVELLLQSRDSAFLLSPRSRALRGNLTPLHREPMFFDLAQRSALASWPGVYDLDQNGTDEVVLATRYGYRVVDSFGEDHGLVPVGSKAHGQPAAARQIGPVRISLSSRQLTGRVVPDDDPGVLDPPPMMFADRSLPMPLAADADGDGRLDLLYMDGESILIHRQSPDGEFMAAATAIVPLPIGEGYELEDLQLVDFGGGDAVDILLVRNEKGASLEMGRRLVQIFLDPLAGEAGDPLPDPIFNSLVECSYLEASLLDVDGDTRPDLALSAWSSKLAVAGVVFERRVLVHLGNAEGGLAKRTAISHPRTYAADSITAFAAVPALPGDLTGDGVADILETDAGGVLEVTPLEWFGRELRVAREPSLRIPVDALVAVIQVVDLNRDGVGDLVVSREDGVDLFVSLRKGS